MLKSRYDYMKESSVVDIDNENYPDPLSVTYNDIQFTQMPTFQKVTEGDLNKFWLYMYKNYGMVDSDDVLLNINGIPYIGTMNPGDIIFNIPPEDLAKFATQKIAGMEDN